MALGREQIQVLNGAALRELDRLAASGLVVVARIGAAERVTRDGHGLAVGGVGVGEGARGAGEREAVAGDLAAEDRAADVDRRTGVAVIHLAVGGERAGVQDRSGIPGG